jgi:hypothetical protein
VGKHVSFKLNIQVLSSDVLPMSYYVGAFQHMSYYVGAFQRVVLRGCLPAHVVLRGCLLAHVRRLRMDTKCTVTTNIFNKLSWSADNGGLFYCVTVHSTTLDRT